MKEADQVMSIKKPSENSFEVFFNTMLVGAAKIVYEPDLRIIWANDFLFDLLGYKRDEFKKLYQNRLSDTIYHEDRFMLLADASRWFYSTNKNMMNLRLVHKNGKVIWLRICSVLTDEYVDDLPILYIVATDITTLKEYELTLHHQSGFLKSVLDSSLIGVVQFLEGRRSKILYSNDMAYQIMGYTREKYQEIYGNYLYSIIFKEDAERVQTTLSQLKLNGPSATFEFRVRKKNGSIIWLLTGARKCINQSGACVFQAEFLDITSLKQAQQEVEERTKQIENLVESVPGGVCILEVGETLQIVYCNDTFCNLLAVKREKYQSDNDKNAESTSGIGSFRWNVERSLSVEASEQIWNAVRESGNSDGYVQLDLNVIRGDGTSIWVGIRAVLYKKTETTSLYHAVVTDITDYKTTQQKMRIEKELDKVRIEQLSNRDALTGLWNKATFHEMAKEILNGFDENLCYALDYSDINNFSYINEYFGYEAGNQVLIDLAECLVSNQNTKLVCRIFSDYFISFHVSKSAEELTKQITERNELIYEKLSKRYSASDIRVTTGIYIIESGSCDVSLAIDNANLARRATKGKRFSDCGFYTEELRFIRAKEQKISSEVHQAMHDGLIGILLQPKFSLDRRRVIGAEALVRWKNEDGSLRMPREFIRTLESVGYIVELDFYVLELVIKKIMEWKEQGKRLFPVSVNFSKLHMNYPDFAEKICEMVNKYGISHELIEIEITESAFAIENEELFQSLEKLRRENFRVDIDDFGVGFSSLSALMVAPVDVVKIDRCFVENVTRSLQDKQYICQICKLIDMTGKEIVFEGVETEEQAKTLTEIGFLNAQGYLFEEPISVEDFECKYM